MKRLEKLIEAFALGLLIVSGSAGFLVSALEFIGTDFENGPWKWLKGPLPITLITVSSLALAVGLERISRFKAIDRRLSIIEQALLEKPIKFTNNYHKLYRTAIDLVDLAQEEIRVLASYMIYDPSPDYYQEFFIGKLKQSKQKNNPIYADIVIGVKSDLDQDVEYAHKRIGEFEEKLARADVRDLVNIHIVDLPWGFDLLIVDKYHLSISFPFPREKTMERKGNIAFTDRPKIVGELATWFDKFLPSRTITYEQFCQKHPKPTKPTENPPSQQTVGYESNVKNTASHEEPDPILEHIDSLISTPK